MKDNEVGLQLQKDKIILLRESRNAWILASMPWLIAFLANFAHDVQNGTFAKFIQAIQLNEPMPMTQDNLYTALRYGLFIILWHFPYEIGEQQMSIFKKEIRRYCRTAGVTVPPVDYSNLDRIVNITMMPFHDGSPLAYDSEPDAPLDKLLFKIYHVINKVQRYPDQP